MTAWRAATVAILLAGCARVSAPERVIPIANASVIGFAADATHEDFEELNDLAIAHDDFVASWGSFSAWTESAGITAETSGPDFTIVAGGKRVRIREGDFGYVLVDPSGRREIIRGVQTDSDLIAVACRFFAAAPQVQEACAQAARGESPRR